MEPLNEKEKALVELHHNLIYTFLRKFKLSEEEFYDVAAMGLIKAVRKYREEVSNFSTFAFICMKTELAHNLQMRKAKRHIPCGQLVSMESGKVRLWVRDRTKEDVEGQAVSSLVVQEILSEMTQTERGILQLMFEGDTIVEAAKKTGFSRAYIGKVRKQFIKNILEVQERD